MDLAEVKKKSAAAYGIALWLSSLAEFSHYTGLLKKASTLPAKKPKPQSWQYSSNTTELNEEVLMRMPKWVRKSKEDDTLRVRQ